MEAATKPLQARPSWIGSPFSNEMSADLKTPALIIDLDAFERNLQKMADHCRTNGISLRPHAKTHKCAEIARRQIAAGAIGQCCASLDEAEMLVGAGIASILVTSPLVAEVSIRRLLELSAACQA